MICIYHSKDLDGYASGAVVKRKFPEAILIGWDYKDSIPELPSSEDIIMIDISFPLEEMIELRRRSKSLTWIDHHISAKNDFDKALGLVPFSAHGINYVYEAGMAACEIGWAYLFPMEPIPQSITLLGRYDTWRQDEGDWENETLPFQYYMRLLCNAPESFPKVALSIGRFANEFVNEGTNLGRTILRYQREQDKKIMHSSFVAEFEGLRALCVNAGGASSNTFLSKWDESKHDVMIPFHYTGSRWGCSIYTTKDDIDCSAIAKKLGGGGHKKASGFMLQELPENWRK